MLPWRTLRLLLFLLFGALGQLEAKFYSAEIAGERLLRDLFVNYDPASRPAMKEERIDINISIELQHFDFREEDGVFTLNGILYATWRDLKLGWNPKDYNNLTRIPVNSPATVWVPDLEFYNNAPKRFLNMNGGRRVMLWHTGNVLWSNTITVTVFCSTNMKNWPHDSHMCKLNLGSWTYDGSQVDIHHAELNNSMNFDDLDMKNMEYRITSFKAAHVVTVYSCCEEPYITVDYNITFERRSAFVVLFRAPALCIIVLTLLALSLEPWRSEKLWLNGISCIIIVFHLLYFARSIGRFARGPPLIVIFHSSSLVLVTFAQLIAVFSLLATRSSFKSKLPWRISRFLQSSWIMYIAAPIEVSCAFPEPDSVELNAQFEDVRLQEYSNLISVTGGSKSNEWLQLAKAVERIALLLYTCIFLVLSTKCFV